MGDDSIRPPPPSFSPKQPPPSKKAPPPPGNISGHDVSIINELRELTAEVKAGMEEIKNIFQTYKSETQESGKTEPVGNRKISKEEEELWGKRDTSFDEEPPISKEEEELWGKRDTSFDEEPHPVDWSKKKEEVKQVPSPKEKVFPPGFRDKKRREMLQRVVNQKTPRATTASSKPRQTRKTITPEQKAVLKARLQARLEAKHEEKKKQG